MASGRPSHRVEESGLGGVFPFVSAMLPGDRPCTMRGSARPAWRQALYLVSASVVSFPLALPSSRFLVLGLDLVYLVQRPGEPGM